jgi:hypothetical protein
MVQNNGDNQSQSDGSRDLILDGAREEPQPGAGNDDAPGAGAGSEVVEPRTYSEGEWKAQQSALDKQVADQRNINGRLAMEIAAMRVQGAENAARAADLRAVEDGDLTEQQAEYQQRTRQAAGRQAQEFEQKEAQLRSAYVQTEDSLRMVAAFELAKEHGIEAKDLLEDPTITPEQMELKAERLALDKEKVALRASGPAEVFDGGGGGPGAGSGSIANMSPEAKIAYGIMHPPRSTKRS